MQFTLFYVIVLQLKDFLLQPNFLAALMRSYICLCVSITLADAGSMACFLGLVNIKHDNISDTATFTVQLHRGKDSHTFTKLDISISLRKYLTNNVLFHNITFINTIDFAYNSGMNMIVKCD